MVGRRARDLRGRPLDLPVRARRGGVRGWLRRLRLPRAVPRRTRASRPSSARTSSPSSSTTEFPTTLLTQAYVPILPKHIWSKYTMDQIGNAEAEGFFDNEPLVVGTRPVRRRRVGAGPVHPLRPQREATGAPQGVADEIILQTFSRQRHDGPGPQVGRARLRPRRRRRPVRRARRTSPTSQTAEGFSNGYTYLSFNTKGNSEGYNGSTSALSDVAFRDALGYALDLDRLVDATLNGHGVAGHDAGAAVPREVARRRRPTPRTFDLDEANRRLDAAGYARNDDGQAPGQGRQGDRPPADLAGLRGGACAPTPSSSRSWFERAGHRRRRVRHRGGQAARRPRRARASRARPTGTSTCGAGSATRTRCRCSRSSRAAQIDNLNDSFYTQPALRRAVRAPAAGDRRGDSGRPTSPRCRRSSTTRPRTTSSYYDNELHAYRTDKFAGWTNQPPDSGTPLFGYGYPGYLALTDAAAATPPPTEAPATAAPQRRRRGRAAAVRGARASPRRSGGDNTMLLARSASRSWRSSSSAASRSPGAGKPAGPEDDE